MSNERKPLFEVILEIIIVYPVIWGLYGIMSSHEMRISVSAQAFLKQGTLKSNRVPKQWMLDQEVICRFYISFLRS